MSITIIQTITPIVDPLILDSDGDETTFPSTYQNVFFDVNVKYQAFNDLTETYLPVTNVLYTPPYPSIIFSVANNDPLQYTIKVAGTYPSTVFPETYSYVLQDGSLVTSTGNVSNLLAIYEWAPPNIKVINITHSFNVQVDGGTYYPRSINQFIYWKLEPSLAFFKNIVSIGI